MVDCSICCEPFNKSNRCKINCKTCDDDSIIACQTCAKRYILEQPTDPSCMNSNSAACSSFKYLPITLMKGAVIS